MLGAVAQQVPIDSSPVGDDEAADRAKRQVERAMNAGLPFAEKMLADHGEFAPFGAVMLPEGLIQTVGTDTRDGDAPVEELYQRLSSGLRRGAESGAYQAIATFVLVQMRKPDDGEIISVVRVALEHRSGYCVDVYYPTVKRGEILTLGDPVAGKRTGEFFEACR